MDWTGLVRELISIDRCEEGASFWFVGTISSFLVSIQLGCQSDSPVYYVFYEITVLELYDY